MEECTLNELKIICMNALRRAYIQNTYLAYDEEAEADTVAAAYMVCDIMLSNAEQFLKKQKAERIAKAQAEIFWMEAFVEYARYGNPERAKLAAGFYPIIKSEMLGFDKDRRKNINDESHGKEE